MNVQWKQSGVLRAGALLLLAAGVVAVIWLATGAGRGGKAAATATTAPVERLDIEVTVEASGTIEPINVVEVKSKASGQIVTMPVEIGSVVAPGDLLVQIDKRDVQNGFDQAQASLRAAEVRGEVAAAQKSRSDQLFAQQVVTAQEHEAAMLDHEEAQSALVRARTDLDLARQRLEDATVRAPIAGTVIEKPVSVGQVISSATSSVSGGTTLLQMADLKRIRLRALVNETDIGNVRTGQATAVIVDAYPERSFRGSVEKVEPKALVDQSVTMFPVLISISNDEGLLLPGMNGEATMLVERREQVLAVPADAVRSMSELSAAAAALGLDPDSLRAAMRANRSRSSGGDSAAVAGARRRGAEGGGAGGAGRTGERRARGADGQRRPGPERAGGAAPAGGADERSGSQARLVFVKTGTGFTPRIVRLGASNYDYVEVRSGLAEGDEVALLSAALLQRQREETLARIRQRVGGALPGGSSSQQGGARTTGGGGR